MRVAHTKTSAQGTITGTDWDADHTLEGVAADDHTHVHDHDADYSATVHTHTAADVGASATGHSHDITHDHDADYAPVHAHPYASDSHNHDASYSGTAHTHDTSHNHDATYSGTAHTHDLTAYATDADLTAHAATPHGGEASEAFPVGSVFLSVVATDPGTLLGYGTWSAFGAGRMLVGNDGGTFGTDEATGGASTHTHAAHSGVISHTHTVSVTDPGHTHVQGVNSTATGGLSGYTADTSTNTRVNSGYSTSSGTTGITASTANPAGGVAELTHDSPSHLPPYIVVHMWKRTA